MNATITTGENRRLRWLLKAASKTKDSDGKPKRPILSGLHVMEKAAVATDGFRLHAIESFYELSVQGLEGQTVTPADLTARSETVDLEPVDADGQRFPNFRAIMPKGEPTFEIAVSAKLLREALEGMPGDAASSVTLRFYGPHTPLEVHGKAADESACYALIMPLSKNHKEIGDPWRP